MKNAVMMLKVTPMRDIHMERVPTMTRANRRIVSLDVQLRI
jgi:hypothetical protein